MTQVRKYGSAKTAFGTTKRNNICVCVCACVCVYVCVCVYSPPSFCCELSCSLASSVSSWFCLSLTIFKLSSGVKVFLCISEILLESRNRICSLVRGAKSSLSKFGRLFLLSPRTWRVDPNPEKAHSSMASI